MLFQQSGSGGGGMVLTATRSAAGRRAAGPATGFTDEPAEVVTLPVDGPGPDPAVLATAKRIAARLAVRRPRHASAPRRGDGNLASLPFLGGSDDIDLDRTIEVLAERPTPDEEDIIVRERVRGRRGVVLAVDVSGSMRGERVRTAAATVGALAAELRRDDLAVLAFWSDAAVIVHLGQRVEPTRLLDTLLRIPAEGLTNVGFPLRVAATELSRVPARDAHVLLLTDAVHNAGPDPRPFAARLSRLDILLDVTGEHDLDLARDLTTAGHGRTYRIRTHHDVAPAVTDAFAGT